MNNIKEILIINQPLNNRGDESAHKGMVRAFLRKLPGVNFTVLHIGVGQSSIEAFRVNDERVNYVNITTGFRRGYGILEKIVYGYGLSSCLLYAHPLHWRIMSYYSKADIVVCAPGGICMGGFQDWGHLFNLKHAKSINKPLVYFGRSFGPFPTKTKNNRLFKKLSFEMLNYFSFLSIRDNETELLAKRLGIKYISTLDSAFLDSPKAQIPQEIVDKINGYKYVVFVPNLLIWHPNYKERISKQSVLLFCSKIIELIRSQYPQYRIVLLPQTFNYGTYEGDDIHFFREIDKMMKDDRIIVLDDCYSSDIQQAIIGGCEFLIGARYHSVVFALNQAVPFLALSYEHKISGLLKRLDKTDCMIDIAHAIDDKESIEMAISTIKKMIPTMKPDFAARDRAKAIANKGLDDFVNFIETYKF